MAFRGNSIAAWDIPNCDETSDDFCLYGRRFFRPVSLQLLLQDAKVVDAEVLSDHNKHGCKQGHYNTRTSAGRRNSEAQKPPCNPELFVSELTSRIGHALTNEIYYSWYVSSGIFETNRNVLQTESAFII